MDEHCSQDEGGGCARVPVRDGLCGDGTDNGALRLRLKYAVCEGISSNRALTLNRYGGGCFDDSGSRNGTGSGSWSIPMGGSFVVIHVIGSSSWSRFYLPARVRGIRIRLWTVKGTGPYPEGRGSLSFEDGPQA